MPRPPSRRNDLDDWLGDDADLDWADTAEQTVVLPGQTGRPPASGSEPDSEFDIREELYRRRRLIALAAIGGGILIVVVLVVVFSGGSNKPAATTPPANTTPANTTPVTTPTTTPTTPVTPAVKVTLPASGSLRSGDSGPEVKSLQQALTALELDPGKIDSSFGPSTEKAVFAFQKANNLAQDGVVGKTTAAKINAALAQQG